MKIHSEMPRSLVSAELGGNQEKGIEFGLKLMKLIADLENVNLNRKQEMAASAIGGAMGAFDAAFDKYDIRTSRQTGDAVKQAVAGENNGEGLPSVVAAGITIARDNLNETAFATLQEVTQAQLDSIRQRDEDVTFAEVENIERRKGGGTLLLFALEVSPDLSEKRKECYNELGYLIQLIDDFQDEQQDRMEGISTIVTLGIAKPEVIKTITRQYSKVKSLFTAEYEQYKLVDLFAYIDKAMRGSGVVV